MLQIVHLIVWFIGFHLFVWYICNLRGFFFITLSFSLQNFRSVNVPPKKPKDPTVLPVPGAPAINSALAV